VTSATSGTVTNATSTITSTLAGMPAGAASNASLTVNSALAVPVLTKTISPSTIGPGGTAQLRLTIRNPNLSMPVSALNLTDNFPGGMVVAAVPSFANTCGGSITSGTAVNDASVVLTGGVITAGQTCVIEVNVTATTPGVYNNTVTSNTSTAGSGTNPSAPLTVAAPTLTKAYTGTGATVDPSQTTTLTFTLTNGAGNPLTTGIAFTDTLPGAILIAATPNVQTNCPAGGAQGAPGFTVTAAPATSVFTVSGVQLNAGVAACTISVDVVSTTPNANCAANPASHTDGAANISALAVVTNGVTNQCLTVRPIPTLTKAFGAANVGLGQTQTLVFSIDNTAAGNIARAALSFTDTLPAGIAIANPPAVTSTACGAPAFTAADATQPFTASGITVAAGATCQITLTVRGTTLGAAVNGAAQITAIAGMNNGVTNQTITVVQPALTKAFTTPVDAGAASTLTFTLTNGAGNPAEGGINFTDTLPAGVVVATPNGLATTCPSGTGVVTATAGTGVITVTGATMNNAQAACTIAVT